LKKRSLGGAFRGLLLFVQMLASLGQSLSADGAREVGLVAQHREETVQLGLHASPLAAEEPADQRDEMEHPSTAEMTCIRDMSGAQF
jgi:hypothetical protein